MNFTIKLAVEDENGIKTIEEVFQINKECSDQCVVGLSLEESKQLLKKFQSIIILNQAEKHVSSKRKCLCCGKNQNIKGYCSIQYRTLFGIVNLESPRLFRCPCNHPEAKTFSPLCEWLSDKNSPEIGRASCRERV